LHHTYGGFGIFLTYPWRSEVGVGDDWTKNRQTVPVRVGAYCHESGVTGCFQTDRLYQWTFWVNIYSEVYSTVPAFLRVPFPFLRFLIISFSMDRDLE
jgi:hypothetical protein